MRPSLAAVLRSPVAAIGVALTTASAFLFLVLHTLHFLGFLQNPYVGILVFVILPALFATGLAIVITGLWLARRRRPAGRPVPGWPRIDLNDPAQRRTMLFVTILTLASVTILSTASYRAVEYSESQQFCGQACHAVMGPEFVAHQNGLHARVTCATCHVGPGAGGFLTAKRNGARQLWLAITGRHGRPIAAPLESTPDVRTSCEQCHWPDRYVGEKIKVFYEHASDEANTQTRTTVRLHVGGPVSGAGSGTGIHWHMNRANAIEYSALDDQRERIPYIRVTTPDGQIREYFGDGASEAARLGRPRRRMDCIDCHNRPAHRFGSSPERAVDAALGEGLISPRIPFIRREAVGALRPEYPSQDVALRQIDRTIREAIAAPSSPFEEDALRRAIAVTQAIYRDNVFPAMKVGWGTYPDHRGHTTSTGCFRCHDGGHKTRDGIAIRQECELCHTIE